MITEPFMDEVHMWTYKGNRKWPKSKEHEFLRSRYRAWLRQAYRFTIDDDMVRMNCNLSHEREKMELWAALARLPYDVMWIEFDLHEKVKEFNRLGSLKLPFVADEVSPVVGYLLVRDLPSKTRWFATEFSKFIVKDVNEIYPSAIDLVFDPEGGEAEIVTGCTTWNTKTLSRIPGFAAIPCRYLDKEGNAVDDTLPPEWLFSGDFVQEQRGRTGIFMNGWAENKVGATFNPLWRRVVMKDKPDEELAELMFIDCKERTGVLRYLVTLLAVINDVPTKVTKVNKPAGGKLAGMHKVPYLDHSHITIHVPKKNAYERVTRILSHQGSKKKRHLVRGHWRIIEYGHSAQCNHLPTMVEDGVGICVRCERLIRWIPNHERGDASLGFVTPDYTVTASEKRRRLRKEKETA